MFHYCEENKNLVAFVSLTEERRVCTNAMILLPGLTDGFMSMSYTEELSAELLKLDYSMVQVNLSSSFSQYGISSLKQDCQELTKLLKAIVKVYKFQKIVMLGHSTGTQDALYYMRYGELAEMVSGVILQAAVSDRDIFSTWEETPHLKQEADKLIAEGKPLALISGRLLGAPITAERYSSLVGRLGDDDMFSVDLTEAELEPILSPVKVPIFLCFSEDDQFVPDKDAQKNLAEKMLSVLRKNVDVAECKYFPGDHGLSIPEHYKPFVYSACTFIANHI